MTALENSLAKALDRKPKGRNRSEQPTSSPDENTETQNTETQKPKARREKAVPHRGRGGHFAQENPHTHRLTVDLTPHQDQVLARFALDHSTKKNPVLRVLIRLLENDEELQRRIAEEL